MLLLIWSVLWVLIPLSGLEGVFPIQVSASSMSGTSNVGPVLLVSGNRKQWAWMLAAWRNPSSPEAHRTHKHIKTSNYKGLTWSGCSDVVWLPEMWETWVWSLGLGPSPVEGNGNPLQYSCLENPHGQRRPAVYSPRGCKVRHDLATKHSTVM